MTKQGFVGVVKSKRPSNGLYFSPFTPPIITSITPRGRVPRTTVTLRGRNFGKRQQDGVGTFAGSTAQVASWSDTAIRVIVLRDATSGYAGVVAHGMTSNGVLYGPLGAPLVTSVSARVLLPDRPDVAPAVVSAPARYGRGRRQACDARFVEPHRDPLHGIA